MSFVHAVSSVRSLSSLVVSDVAHKALRGFADSVKGFGPVQAGALFVSGSEASAQAAAEAVAHESGRPLLRVDMRQVVSNYLGETQTNLEHVFKTAEGKGAILFLDQADALFGKRTEVRDSHDRYAQVEAESLLRRIEQYGRPVVVATHAPVKIPNCRFCRQVALGSRRSG